MSYTETVEEALACFAEPGRRDAYFNLYSEDVVLHGYDGVEPGLDSVRRYYAAIWAAFPDARVNVEEMIEINDRIVLRFIMTGTHRAPFLGLNATGRFIHLPGMTILRFMNQKCVERWSVTNSLSLLAQLGGFPVNR